jgi:hypothetical protein
VSSGECQGRWPGSLPGVAFQQPFSCSTAARHSTAQRGRAAGHQGIEAAPAHRLPAAQQLHEAYAVGLQRQRHQLQCVGELREDERLLRGRGGAQVQQAAQQALNLGAPLALGLDLRGRQGEGWQQAGGRGCGAAEEGMGGWGGRRPCPHSLTKPCGSQVCFQPPRRNQTGHLLASPPRKTTHSPLTFPSASNSGSQAPLPLPPPAATRNTDLAVTFCLHTAHVPCCRTSLAVQSLQNACPQPLQQAQVARQAVRSCTREHSMLPGTGIGKDRKASRHPSLVCPCLKT